MIKLFSPSKLNLFFRVLGKRFDGYHEIASLMQAIDFCDEIELSLGKKDEVSCSDVGLACDETNLVCRAREVFRTRYGLGGVRIRLIKRVWMQAGLGGGSGNAATVLWGLNQLVGGLVSEGEFKEMAAELGSDVPFFFSSGTARCTGRGEKVESLAEAVEVKGWVVKPHFGLSTKVVYERVRENRLQSVIAGDVLYYNDLECFAFEAEPRLKLVKEMLLREFAVVMMTGSGTAFFCSAPLHTEVQFMEDLLYHPISSIQRKEKEWYVP